jgi:hypothetical protein
MQAADQPVTPKPGAGQHADLRHQLGSQPRNTGAAVAASPADGRVVHDAQLGMVGVVA